MKIDASATLAILGTASSVVGLLLAAVQSIRLRELRRRTNADVWLSIRTTRSMIRKLEPEARRQNPQVAEVYGKLTELFCHLLKQAVLDERQFTEETIRKWRDADKLDSNWQEAQARQFLPTSAIRGSNKLRGGVEGSTGTATSPNPAAPADQKATLSGR